MYNNAPIVVSTAAIGSSEPASSSTPASSYTPASSSTPTPKINYTINANTHSKPSQNKGCCRVTAGTLDFIVGISVDDAEDTKSTTYDFDSLDYVLVAYNEKYKFTMQAKVHANNKEPMENLISDLRNAVNEDRIVVQLDRKSEVLHVATIMKYINGKPITYRTSLVASRYNKFHIRDIFRQIENDERKLNYMWKTYTRTA